MTTLLIVRHGPGRGRMEGYMDSALGFMRHSMPEVFQRLRLHATGDPAPDLADTAAVVFWLADPLQEWYPACFAEADGIAREARALGIPLVTPPESLSNTVRSVQARLWEEAGVPTPAYRRFESVNELHALLQSESFPVLIRSDEHHAQQSMHVVRSPADLAALDPQALMLPGAVAPLVDVRAEHRKRNPNSIYARLYHKKRLYVLGDRVRTEHVFFSREPVVGAKTYTFLRYGRIPAALHWLSALDKWNRIGIREDVAYWRREQDHEPLMVRAAAALGIGFGAVDYSDLGNGEVILWEMNPHPSLPRLEWMPLPGPRRTRERMESYYRAIGLWLQNLLDSPLSP